MLKINYMPEVQSQNIDLKKLRPNKSYDYLVKNRNAAFEAILSDPEKKSKLLVDRNCPNCDSAATALEARKDGFDIVKCRTCELLYVNPMFDDAAYVELYDSREYNQIVTKHSISSHEYRRDRFGVERADFVNRFHDGKLEKRFLDVGCASGFTLEAIERLGWDAIGLELTTSSVHFGRARGLNIINQTLEEYKPQHKFSAVALFDVLEHLARPKSALKCAHNLLSEGGNLFVYVPNWNSASRYLMGVEGSHFVWPTHHLTYFTPITLQSMLNDAGFDVFHWETQGLDLQDYVWYLENVENRNSDWLQENTEMVQFFINASGHGKNLRMFAQKRRS